MQKALKEVIVDKVVMVCEICSFWICSFVCVDEFGIVDELGIVDGLGKWVRWRISCYKAFCGMEWRRWIQGKKRKITRVTRVDIRQSKWDGTMFPFL